MDRYKYAPLDAAKSEIRLIRLLPGAFSDDIEIEIFHAESHFRKEKKKQKDRSMNPKLEDQLGQAGESREPASYEALSYVWGSEADPSFVSVREDGQPSSSRLPVTSNLYEAIRYLRKENEARVLWIDAVCINQKDLVERSVEVGRMGDIFRNAMRVVVWLGPESSSSGVAVSFINAMAADLMTDGAPRAEYTILPGSETAKVLSNPHDLQPKMKALRRLCQRQWFTRLWIYQEYHLSTAAIAIIGRTACDMRDLYKVLRFIRVGQTGIRREQMFHSWEVSKAAKVLKPINPILRPLDIMRQLRYSTCSDERDRVYAILGLISAEYRAAIVPDYTKSLQEVNKEFFLCTLRMQRTVRLPGGLEQQSGSTSWLPNSAHTLITWDMCFASGQSQHEIVYERSDESLRLPSKAISTIAKIWFSVPERRFTHDTLGLFRAHALLEMRDQVYPLGGNMLDAYICSLAGGTWREVLDLAWCPTLQELRDILQSGDPSKETMTKARTWFKIINKRAFFSTSEGFIGLCPPSGKVGDQIYVTPGVRMLILLSPVDDRPNYYRLKGECYVHGLMNSEALLGPLPELASGGAWDYKFNHIQGVYEVAFTNGEVTTQNDPRLAPLPEGWRKLYWSDRDHRFHSNEFEADGTMRLLNYQNLSTNKIGKCDPRMTSTALKERRVPFEDIIII